MHTDNNIYKINSVLWKPCTLQDKRIMTIQNSNYSNSNYSIVEANNRHSIPVTANLYYTPNDINTPVRAIDQPTAQESLASQENSTSIYI